MTYRVTITFDIEDRDAAVKLLSDLNEVGGKANADLMIDAIENLDDLEDEVE